MGPRIVAEKTIKLAAQELLGFVTLGSLPADRVKRHFGARQWLFHAFLRVCICAHGLWWCFGVHEESLAGAFYSLTQRCFCHCSFGRCFTLLHRFSKSLGLSGIWRGLLRVQNQNTALFGFLKEGTRCRPPSLYSAALSEVIIGAGSASGA